MLMLTSIYQFIKTWKLPVAMITGVLIYYITLPLLSPDQGKVFYCGVSHWLQPLLIFTMLFLSFLKVEPKELRPHRWHGVLLLTQALFFILFSLLAYACRDAEMKIILEGAMLCFVCPTATASAVIVQKLGGSLSGDVTYIVLCNLMVSLLAPGFFTLVEPHSGMDFFTELFMIMGKVFPLLLCPLFVALIVRYYLPALTQRMLSIRDLAFYLWLVALALAITVTWKTIVESDIRLSILLGLALVSAISCVVQFALGRKIGERWGDDRITAGQAFGQKNTVFVIWLGLVFLNPVTSIVGGLYSIWHNVINSWQLYKKQAP